MDDQETNIGRLLSRLSSQNPRERANVLRALATAPLADDRTESSRNVAPGRNTHATQHSVCIRRSTLFGRGRRGCAETRSTQLRRSTSPTSARLAVIGQDRSARKRGRAGVFDGRRRGIPRNAQQASRGRSRTATQPATDTVALDPPTGASHATREPSSMASPERL